MTINSIQFNSIHYFIKSNQVNKTQGSEYRIIFHKQMQCKKNNEYEVHVYAMKYTFTIKKNNYIQKNKQRQSYNDNKQKTKNKTNTKHMVMGLEYF